ncbi:hypothetical protein ACFLRT_02265 [Acidobacteriota bacterium]
MKRFIIICMLIMFLLPLSTAGKDKIKIICSPLGGYSILPESEYQISYMNPDGSVKWEKLNRLLQEIANTGANMWREFPPWILNQQQYQILTPFIFENEEMVLNPRYFINLGKIARLSKEQYNLIMIYDLFNASETLVSPVKNHSPWKKYKGYFYTAPEKHLAKYIDAVLEAHQGLGVRYQLCNEPSFEQPEFMCFVYCHLIEKGIPPERIVIGYDMRLKAIGGIHGTGYRKFRELVVAKLGKEYEIKIKTLSWSPFHATSDQSLTRYWGLETPPGGQRREIFSLDGRRLPKRPDENESYALFKRILQTKNRKVELGRIGAEVIYGKEAGIDPLAQLRGLVKAYEECLEKTPENKGNYPKPLPLPNWIEEGEPDPDPEPEEPPKGTFEGISIDEIIEWVKRNPWIVQLITERPDNEKLKEELVKYFNNHAAWEQEKQEILQELTETGNTEKNLQAKMQEIAQLKAQALEIETDTIDDLKLLLNKKNEIILELESALQISNTLSQSNHLFYANEFQLRYIANGILKDAGDNMEKTNLFTIGVGGYYDPWKKTYGVGIFVGIDIRNLFTKIL